MAEENLSGLQNVVDSAQSSYDQNRDVYSQQRLMTAQKALQTAKNSSLTAKWYGEGSSTDPAPPKDPGFVERAMDIVSAPMRAGEGAVSYALGKSPDASLGESMWNNAWDRKENYGDLLRKLDIPNYVAMPVGFALDVFLDPVNWATAGTAALIPRVAIGAKAAGLEGAGLALKSGLYEKASTLSKLVPGAKNISAIAGDVAKEGIPAAELQRLAGEEVQRVAGTGLWGKTEAATDAFNKARGFKDPASAVKGIIDTSKTKVTQKAESFLSDETKAILESNPKLAGLVRFFEYNPDRWMEAKAIEQAVKHNDPDALLRAKKYIDDPDKLEEAVRQNLALFNDLDPRQVQMATFEESNKLLKNTEDIRKQVSATFIANAKAKMAKEGYLPMLINARAKIMEMPWLEAAYQNYNTWVTDMFKMGKTIVNPSSHMFQWIGNSFMGKAEGLDMGWDHLTTINSTRRALSGEGSAFEFMRKYFTEPAFLEWAKDNGYAFKQKFGATLEDFLFRGAVDMTLDDMGTAGFKSFLESLGGDPQKMIQEISQIYRKKGNVLMQKMLDASDAANLDKDALMGYAATRSTGGKAVDTMGNIVKSAKRRDIPIEEAAKEYGTGLASQDLAGTGRILNRIKEAGIVKDGKPTFVQGAAKWVGGGLEKFGSSYGRIDQSFKLGTMMHMVSNGITEGELRMLSRFHKINEAQILGSVTRGGIIYYKMDPALAAKITDRIYMNYQAMPAFIRMMGKTPLIGTPFASFPAAMLLDKLPSTMKNNPAFFSKMESLMNEIKGDESPIEKKMKEKNAYAKLQALGQQRLGFIPFFKDNPLYLKIGSMVPFLSINQLDPSERTWGEGAKGKVLSALDTWLMNDPIGQVFKDYFLPAMVLGDTEDTTVGRMGQKILPVDPTLFQRVGYAARAVGEASPLGSAPATVALAPLVSAMPSEAAAYIPNFRARDIGLSAKGQNPIGVSRNEDQKLQLIRAIGKMIGIDTTNVPLAQYKDTPNK